MSKLRKFVLPGLGILLAAACALVLVVVIGGLSRSQGDTEDTEAAEPPAPATATVAPWTTKEVPPDAVHVGGNSRTVVVRLAVPDGGENCARNVKLTKVNENDVAVFAKLTYDTRYPNIKGPCYDRAPTQTDLPLTADQPIGSRDLVVNEDHLNRWHHWGVGYGHCSAEAGCVLPADHCDSGLLDATVRIGDPRFQDSPLTSLDVRGCDPAWLVFDRRVGGCDDLARPCTDALQGHRYYYRWGGSKGWLPVAKGERGGCDDVHAAEPKFPSGLCAGLTPVPN